MPVKIKYLLNEDKKGRNGEKTVKGRGRQGISNGFPVLDIKEESSPWPIPLCAACHTPPTLSFSPHHYLLFLKLLKIVHVTPSLASSSTQLKCCSLTWDDYTFLLVKIF